MFKFLRRYNKYILSVGGVLLMITFLIPQATTRLSQSAAERRASIGTVGNGEAVPATEWQVVQAEVDFMNNIGVRFPGIGAVDKPSHWYLLVREAEQAGLVGRVTVSDDEMAALLSRARELQHNSEFIR